MFDRPHISSLAAVLERREASLWHACGLTDFAGYAALGAIGSGADLERVTGVPRVDGADGPDDQLRVRLHDAGHEFAAGRRLLPDPAGPISFQLHPRALERGRVLAASGGAEAQAAAGAALVALTAPDDANEPWPFSGPDPDLTLILGADGRIPLSDVIAIWVDPVHLGGIQLLDLVEGMADAGETPLRVRRRTRVDPGRRTVWNDLGRLLGEGAQPLLAVWRRRDATDEFRAWTGELRSGGMDALFARLARGLFEGTLAPLRQVAEMSPGRPRTRIAVPVTASVPGEAGEAGEAGAAVADATADGDPFAPDRPAFPPRPRPASVRACGHPRLTWAPGACPGCLREYRSRWRYADPA